MLICRVRNTKAYKPTSLSCDIHQSPWSNSRTYRSTSRYNYQKAHSFFRRYDLRLILDEYRGLCKPYPSSKKKVESWLAVDAPEFLFFKGLTDYCSPRCLILLFHSRSTNLCDPRSIALHHSYRSGCMSFRLRGSIYQAAPTGACTQHLKLASS